MEVYAITRVMSGAFSGALVQKEGENLVGASWSEDPTIHMERSSFLARSAFGIDSTSSLGAKDLVSSIQLPHSLT